MANNIVFHENLEATSSLVCGAYLLASPLESESPWNTGNYGALRSKLRGLEKEV